MALVQTHTAKTKMQGLLDWRQAVCLDYLSRGMTRSGDLHALIDDGLRGMTSNPTIFEHAIGGTADYDDELTKSASSPKTDRDAFENAGDYDVPSRAETEYARTWVGHTCPSYLRQNATMIPPAVRLTS